MKKICISTLLLIISISIYSQQEETNLKKIQLKKIIDSNIVKGSIYWDDSRLLEYNFNHVYSEIKINRKNYNWNDAVISEPILHSFLIKHSRDTVLRKQICYEYLKLYFHERRQLLGKNIYHFFSSYDFSDSASRILSKIIETNQDNSMNSVYTYWIIGKTNNPKFLPILQNKLDSITDIKFNDDYWAIKYAMARIGDKNSINECIQHFYIENNNEVERALNLKNIIYIRQYELIKVIIPFLKSYGYVPNTKSPLNPKAGTPFKRYAMDAVQELFVDFPKFDRGLGEYTDEQVLTTLELLKNPIKYQLNK